MNATASTSKRILVFDSGLGGLSIVQELSQLGLDAELFYCADTAYFPYGEKSNAALIARVPAIISKAVALYSPDLVIIACNTASTLALKHVRTAINIPVVGVVPAIKPAAALTKSGVIGLLGTPNTVGRPYTDQLILDHAQGRTVLRHGAIGLAGAAEAKLAGANVDMNIIAASIDGLFGQPGGEAIDVVVLACTHYPHLKAELMALASQRANRPAAWPIIWIDSGAAIARRAQFLLNIQTGSKARLRHALTSGGEDGAAALSLKRWGFEDVMPLPQTV